MKTPGRKGTLILGILLLVCAVIALIKAIQSSPNGKEGVSQEPTARQGNVTSENGTSGQSRGEATTSLEGEPILQTKTKQRPIETALDKKLKERHRLEEKMKIYQGNGLGERHPSMLTLMNDLKKVDAEIAAAGDEGAKLKERPIETGLDKKRKERHRLEEKMKIYQGNGLGERHPSMLTLMNDLKKVEAEIAAAGGEDAKAAE